MCVCVCVVRVRECTQTNRVNEFQKALIYNDLLYVINFFYFTCFPIPMLKVNRFSIVGFAFIHKLPVISKSDSYVLT